MAEADIDIDVKPASAVFIDVPNIAKGRNLSWREINWRRLSQSIATTSLLMDTSLIKATAYVGSWHDREDMIATKRVGFQTFGRNVDMQVRSGDDIDSLIIEDMWEVVVRHEQESIRNGKIEYPLRVRFILVSGDSDYLRTIRKMRKAFGENLELEFYVYSWLSQFSGELHDEANGYYYLDDLRGFKHLG